MNRLSLIVETMCCVGGMTGFSGAAIVSTWSNDEDDVTKVKESKDAEKWQVERISNNRILGF